MTGAPLGNILRDTPAPDPATQKVRAAKKQAEYDDAIAAWMDGADDDTPGGSKWAS